MVPATHWVDVTKFNGNINLAPPFSLRTRDELWQAITDDGQVTRFGIPNQRRHEPPRRFRVTGDHIRPGASLHLGMAMGAAGQNPQFIEMELFPTGHVDDDGRQIWETTVEANPMLVFALLNGGMHAPQVQEVLTGDYSNVDDLDPVGWNSYAVKVVNADQTTNAVIPWETLEVDDR